MARKLAVVLKAQALERVRDDHALLLVVRARNALEGLQAIHGQRPARRLVGHHSANSAPEDLARAAPVLVALGVLRRQTLPLERGVLERVAVKRPRHFDLLSADADPLLPVQELLREDGREPPE